MAAGGGGGGLVGLPYMESNIIDLSLLTSSSSATVSSAQLNKLHHFLSSWGCFQLVNHGMTIEFLDEIRELGKQFFALPKEEKEKYGISPNDPEGYGTDAVSSDILPLKWQYRLFLTAFPLEKRKLDRWPQSPQPFRKSLEEYTMKVKRLYDIMLQAIAQCLKLKDNAAFVEEFGGRSEIVSRFQLYVKTSLIDLIRASSKHADSAILTFLLQDREVEALEVEKDGHWFKAPIIPHALFVNVGDLLEIITNGIFKSPLHRIAPNPEKQRITLAVFGGPPQENEVGPLKELVTIDQPAMYKRVTNYRQIFLKYHPTGIRPITTVKI